MARARPARVEVVPYGAQHHQIEGAVLLQLRKLGKLVVQPFDPVAVERGAGLAERLHRLDRQHVMSLFGEPRRVAARARADIRDSGGLARQEIEHRRIDLLGRKRVVAGDQLRSRRCGIIGQHIVHSRSSLRRNRPRETARQCARH